MHWNSCLPLHTSSKRERGRMEKRKKTHRTGKKKTVPMTMRSSYKVEKWRTQIRLTMLKNEVGTLCTALFAK